MHEDVSKANRRSLTSLALSSATAKRRMSAHTALDEGKLLGEQVGVCHATCLALRYRSSIGFRSKNWFRALISKRIRYEGFASSSNDLSIKI